METPALRTSQDITTCIYIRSSTHTEYGIEFLASPGIPGIELEKRYLEYSRTQLTSKNLYTILRIPLDHINSFTFRDEFVIFPWNFFTFPYKSFTFPYKFFTFPDFCHIYIYSFTFSVKFIIFPYVFPF